MSKFRLAHLGLLAALIGLNVAPVFVDGAATAYAADTVRPEIGKPLQAAGDDIKKGKYKEALAKIHDADAVGNRTPYENYMIEYLRAAAAQGAGDRETAAKSYEAVIASGKVTGAAQTTMIKTVATLYYGAGDYPKAITWLNKAISEGGDDAQTRGLLVQAYFSSGDVARAYKETQAQVNADEKAGRVPSEEALSMLQSCAYKLNDKAGEAAALEKLVTFHPTKSAWVKVLNRLSSKSGFNDTRLGLDVFRLKMAIGAVTSTADLTNMVELTLQAGYPAEAVKVINFANKTGAFGSGDQAARQKRLQTMAENKAKEDAAALAQNEAKAKDGNDLVNVGYDYVTNGQADKGIPLMEQGIAKGDLAHPDEAKLHLGIAYLQADKKAKGLQALKGVHGTDGTGDLAHYWTLVANHPVN
ncbi:MAG: hypothetical protein JO269_13260 [Burkholderiaceae bacterium]|nr:hypothetical protein [Burkholderiaceae bacterium]